MSEYADVPVDEMMEEVARVSGGRPVAILDGYVSAVEQGFVRFHRDIDPSVYVEIPRDEILYSTTIDGERGKLSRLVVRRAAELAVVSLDTIRAGDLVDDGASGGATELIDLRNIGIPIVEGLKAIRTFFRCAKLREELLVLDYVIDELGDRISEETRKEAEEERERVLDDLQDCPHTLIV